MCANAGREQAAQAQPILALTSLKAAIPQPKIHAYRLKKRNAARKEKPQPSAKSHKTKGETEHW
jgi:hypothetical protein